MPDTSQSKTYGQGRLESSPLTPILENYKKGQKDGIRSDSQESSTKDEKRKAD